MIHRSIKAGLVFFGVTLTPFCAASYALYVLTINVGNGGELAGYGFIAMSPLVGLFLVLSVGAGLVASHMVYRRSQGS